MSSFFANEDNITFGVQGSNIVEVAQWSSTLDDVMFRFFTNNGAAQDNFVTGTVIGSSNYDKTAAARNDLYFGHVTEYSNVERIMTIRENRVGINTSEPSALFEVSGSNASLYDLTRITMIDATGTHVPALTINSDGEIGIGTEAVSGQAMTILGKLQVSQLQIGGGSSGDSSLITTEGLQPPTGISFLRFADASFCNITSILLKDSLVAQSNLVASNVLMATNIKPVTGSTIQFTQANLSNIANLYMNYDGVIAVDKISGSSNVSLINFTNSTLSNINTVSLSYLTTTNANNTIDVSQKSLSNISFVRTDSLRTSTLYGSVSDNTINGMGTVMSNLGDVRLQSGSTLYTRNISAADNGTTVNFTGMNVTNVNDLYVSGDIRVNGEFFVMDTTTCNTNQFRIDNDGTGPALIVNQQGINDIAQFMDDSNIVMFIKDGGQTAFGSFGNNMSNTTVNGLVYIENQASQNQDALYVDQHNATQNRLVLNGPSCNVVVSGTGRLGLGTDAPQARIHAVHQLGDQTEFIRMSSNADPSFIVTSGAQVGIGTNPVGTGMALFVKGSIETTEIVRAYGMVAPSNKSIAFGSNTLSNITAVKADQIQMTSSGVAASPAYTFENDTNTGIFQPAQDEIALSTGGTEKLRVNAQGNVGIGTDTMPVTLYINRNDSIRIPVGTDLQRPTGQPGYIRFNTSTSNFEGYSFTSWGSLGGVKDVNQDTYISAENTPNENNDQLKFFTSNVQRMYIGNDEEQGFVGIGTTAARVRLDIDNGTMRADRVQINTLSSTGSTINVDSKILSNITTTQTGTLETSFIDTIAPGKLINVMSNSLSNITLLSKVGTIDVARLTTTTNSNVIDVTFQSLSNIHFTRTSNLEVTNISTVATSNLINVQQNSLSNIKLLSKVGTLDVNYLTNTFGSNLIDVTYQTLSNINTTKTATLEVSVITTAAQNKTINVENNSLSNITLLHKVGTIDVAKITTTTSDHVIDVTFQSFSNINFTRTSNLEVTNIYTTAQSNLINVQNNSLSNIATLSKVGTIDVAKITTTTSDNVIDVTFQSFSNIDFTRTKNLEVSFISTVAPGSNINVQKNTLSNIAVLSKVGTIDVDVFHNTNTGVMDVSFQTFSNIDFTKTCNLEVTNIFTTAASNLINVQNNSLSNIEILSKVGTVDVGKLTNTLRDTIDVTNETLSNINFVKASNLEVFNLTTLAPGGLINVQNNSLSNIQTLSKVGVVDTAVITKTFGSSNINVDQKSLSNIDTVYTTNVRVSTITGPDTNNYIHFNETTLSNLGSVYIRTDETLHVNKITAADSSNINFNQQNLTNINNLYVSGDIIARGEFFVMETTTCNTNQFRIDNDGTGPALIVNQQGINDIAQFMDDSNIIMFLQDGGQASFGSFGNSMDLTVPSAQVYIENPSTTSRTALYVKQEASGQDMLHVTNGVNPVVVDYLGNVGIGTQHARAHLHIYGSNSIRPLVKIQHISHPASNIEISSDGRIGIATEAPTNVQLFVNGETQTNKLITSSVTAAANNLIDFNDNILSNIQVIHVGDARVPLLQGTGPNKIINVTQSTLSNINVVSTSTLIVKEISSSNTQNVISVADQTLSNIKYVKTSNLEVSTITSLYDQINVSQKTLSNINVVKTNGLEVNKITSLNNLVDASQVTFSNLNYVRTSGLEVTEISSLTQNISMASRTLSNMTAIVTPNIVGVGQTKDLSMNYSRVVDVDHLVVRSNISVTLTGLNTFTNLPTDLVRIDQATGKILDQYISSNIVRLMGDGLINPAMIPSVESGRNTLLHTRDRVGIGLRNPQQKLHVHGTQVITSGRFGIGTTAPLHAIHVVDDNSSISSFAIECKGSTDAMRVSGSNSTPLLFITASCNVGIRTSGPAYELHVQGTSYASTAVRTNAIESDTGVINFRSTSLSNVHIAHIQDLYVEGTIYGTVAGGGGGGGGLSSSVADKIDINTLSALANDRIVVENAMHVTGYTTALYGGSHDQLIGDATDATRIGIKVDNSILARTLLTISDRRVKNNVVLSASDSDLQTLLDIPVKRFRFIDTPQDPEIVGFIAQEVEEVAPYAVRTTVAPVPSIVRELPIVDEHSLRFTTADRNTVHLEVGSILKALNGGNELFLHITGITDTNIIVEETLPTSQATLFVYGHVVNDFKLLDSERLVPIVFNAVKEMHIHQQNMLARIDRLEAALASLLSE